MLSIYHFFAKGGDRMPEISIVIPVYNTEKYLDNCIQSILSQTFQSFEIILVDDGSSDSSGLICDQYAKMDSRILVIHQENRGVSAARNRGLDNASGRYLFLPDSDDYLEKNALELMHHCFTDSTVDVVVCGINYRTEKNELMSTAFKGHKYYTNDELIDAVFGTPNPLGGGCWNKMFSMEKIRHIRFDESITNCEDWFYLLNAFQNCSYGIQIPECLYNVITRHDSLTRKKPIDSMFNIILSFEYLWNSYLRSDLSLNSKALDKLLDTCVRYIKLIRDAGNENGDNTSLMIIRIKTKILKYTLYGWVNHILSKGEIHRFLIEGLRS